MRAKAYIVHRAMCAPELEWSKPKDCLHAEPLYAKREWHGLTRQEAEQLVEDYDWYNDPVSFCFDVEAKLKEKNT